MTPQAGKSGEDFGDDGFEKTVNRVAKLEQAIGIHFTGLQGK